MKKVNLNYVPLIAAKLRCSSYYLLGITDYETNYPDEAGVMRTPVIIKSVEDEYITIRQLQDAYDADRELVKLCIKMMQGTKEQRKYYRTEIKRLLSVE